MQVEEERQEDVAHFLLHLRSVGVPCNLHGILTEKDGELPCLGGLLVTQNKEGLSPAAKPTLSRGVGWPTGTQTQQLTAGSCGKPVCRQHHCAAVHHCKALHLQGSAQGGAAPAQQPEKHQATGFLHAARHCGGKRRIRRPGQLGTHHALTHSAVILAKPPAPPLALRLRRRTAGAQAAAGQWVPPSVGLPGAACCGGQSWTSH